MDESSSSLSVSKADDETRIINEEDGEANNIIIEDEHDINQEEEGEGGVDDTFVTASSETNITTDDVEEVSQLPEADAVNNNETSIAIENENNVNETSTSNVMIDDDDNGDQEEKESVIIEEEESTGNEIKIDDNIEGEDSEDKIDQPPPPTSSSSSVPPLIEEDEGASSNSSAIIENNNKASNNDDEEGESSVNHNEQQLTNNNTAMIDEFNNTDTDPQPPQQQQPTTPSSPKQIIETTPPPPSQRQPTSPKQQQQRPPQQLTTNKKRLDKLQRRIPSTLDLDYITPQLIGMAPPKRILQDADNTNKSLSSSTTTQSQQKNKKREKGNDPGELSTFLEKRHPKRYLLFNVSDDHVNDRTLLLLGRQVVHLPWGSPRVPHPTDSTGELMSTPLTNTSVASTAGGGTGNKSSGTPAVSRVMDICYALHAYLSIPPCEIPLENPSSSSTATAATSTTSKQRKGTSSSSNKESTTKTATTVACIYCSNGKTRTGVIVACYLRFCNEVSTSLKGFEIFCERRGIMSSSSNNNNTDENNNKDISSHIPPSLRQFFINFDLLIYNKQYPYPHNNRRESELILSSIQLYGVPVDDMPCIDIWEHGGNEVRKLVYASHNNTTDDDNDNINNDTTLNSTQLLNVWDDEEGSYNLNLPLQNDFTLICRFGGQFANDINDPSKVLFRYVNCPNFLNEGLLELTMVDVDMMRRYADSFDDDEFMLSLTFETVNNNEEEEDGSSISSPLKKKHYQRKRTLSHASMGGDGGALAAKFNGMIQSDIKDVILQGWKVLSDAHLSYLSSSVVQSGLDELSKEAVGEGQLLQHVQQHEVDFRYVALQITNGDVELAKVELRNGLFKSLLLDTAAQQQQQHQQKQKPALGEESLLEQPPILDNDVLKEEALPVLKNEEEEEEEEEELEEQSSVPLRALLSTAGSTEYDQSCGPDDDNDDEEDNDTVLEADQSLTLPSVSHLDEKEQESNAVVNVEDESSFETKVYHPESESAQVDVESESTEAKVHSSHPQVEDEMPIESTESILPEEANNEEVVTTETSQNINNDEFVNDTETEIASETKLIALPVVDNGDKSTNMVDESRERASTPDIDTSSEEDGPTVNTPFADQSRSSLLEAIQMRGLKHSISNRQVGGNDNRSSLLMEIRNKASNKEGLTSHSPSSHVDEDAISGDNNSENVDPAETGLTLTVDMDLEHIVGQERAFSNSTSSDAGVMLIELDQSVSTRNTRNDYEKDSTLSIASGNSSEQVDTKVDAPLVPSETLDTTNVEKIIDDDVKVDTAADERGTGSSQFALESTTAIETDEVSSKQEEIPLNKDPVYEKYYRMLKLGLPMGAVKNAMQRDGLDPTVLDLDAERSLDSQRPQTKTGTTCAGIDSTKNQESDECKTPTPSIWSSRLGFPEDWQALPQSNGSMAPEFPVDKDDDETDSTQLPTVTPGEKEEAPPLNKDPTYEKYYRMLKMGLPMGAVKNAVQRDELDPAVLDLDPEKSLESQLVQGKVDAGDGNIDYDGATATENKVDTDIESRRNDGQMENVGGSCDNEQDETLKDEVVEEPEPDPRKALMAMLNKRVPPTPTPEVDDKESKTEAKEDDEIKDPREALMSMLNKRAPPAAAAAAIVEEPSNAESKEEEETEPDPRAALMSMLNKRAPPTPVVDESKTKANEEGKEEADPDPRAALMSMLNKRAPPTPAVDESKTEAEESKDPRAALMSMLNKRSPPIPADEPENKADDQESETKEADPRAALMSMISKRAPPQPTEESKSAAPQSSSTDTTTADKAPAEKDEVPTIRNDPRFTKYFKMLKMGLPIGAVKNAMQRDEQDPTIMDLDLDASLESQRPPEKSGDDGPPLKDDPAYEKYFKMLKMGLPKGAVQNAMQRDGLDPSIMDLDPTKSVASQMKKEDDGPPLKDDPKYSKYFKMLKMGLPMGAVKNAMQRDGEDPSIMDMDPEKSVACQLEEEKDEDIVDEGPPLKEDPKYTKYFKMLKMGLPKGAVQNAMQRDGEDPSIMDLDPEKSLTSQLDKEDDVADEGPPLKDDPTYSKYFKMLKMGLPKGAVQNAMQRDGEDPSIMDLDPEKSVASQRNKEEELVDKGPPLKDDPTYSKFFKMLKMGLPMGAVQNAMQREGLDPSIMDLDPEKSVEYQKAMASNKSKKKAKKKTPKKDPKKPKVRRKKIFWSPIEESKMNDNSLWSMIKGSYDFESLNVDQDEFESLFTDTSNPSDKKKAVTEKPKESKQKKSVQVIDAKRGMNGGIILARIKIDFSLLADMVTEMDCGNLDDTQLKALREFLPTKDERFAIDGYIKGASASSKTKEAAINDLCACEKYMLAMMKVEMADEKFEAMLFKYQFDNKLKELMHGVTTLINACEEVQKSVRLRKLMAMILMLGNRINTGGSGNMAHGFTLDALLKLDEAKAFDKKTSVLQYLVKLVKSNEPDLLKVHEEMPSIGPAENVIVDGLVSELNELNSQLSSVKGTAAAEGKRIRDGKNPASKLSPLDRLRQQKTKIKDVDGVNMYNIAEAVDLTAMEKFVKYAEKRAKEAFARIGEVQENFKGVLTYFGEDPAMSSTDFFGTLNKFVAAFDSALEIVKRIEALNLAEEKKAAARREKEATKKAATKSAPPANQVSVVSAQDSKGKLDLAGQRKQFADPFTGPDTDAKSEEEVQSDAKTSSEKKEVKGVDPRAALMTMLNKRAPPTVDKSKTEAKEDDDVKDPRAALMSMLNKRAPPAAAAAAIVEEPSNAESKEEEETEPDPRAALMSMLNKRAPPTPAVDESKTKANEEEKEEADPDPRAALMLMLNKRAPPTVEEPPDADDKEGEKVQEDPRAALMKMLGNRQLKVESVVVEKDGAAEEDVPQSPSSPGTRGFFPATSPNSTSSPGRKGFFPATSPTTRAKQLDQEEPTAREARYEAKTSSIARGGDTTPIQHEDRKNLYEITSSQTKPSKKANRINPHIEADAKTEAKVMLVAAMAAASARNKSPMPNMNDVTKTPGADSDSGDALKRANTPDSGSSIKVGTDSLQASKPAASSKKRNEKPKAPMGIAALAAAAARKKNAAWEDQDGNIERELSVANNNGSAIVEEGTSQPTGSFNEGGDNLPLQPILNNDGAVTDEGCIPPLPDLSVDNPAPAASLYQCAACHFDYPKERFSKSQLGKLKKKENGRCKQCIDAQRPAKSPVQK